MNPNFSQHQPIRSILLLAFFLVSSLCLNAVFIFRGFKYSQGASADVSRLRLKSVEPITVNLADGQKVELPWHKGNGTVVYFADPRCGWCKRNIPAFQALHRNFTQQGVQFYILTPNPKGVESLIPDLSPPPKIILDEDGKIAEKLRLKGTPDTLLVANSGKVLGYWSGAYAGRTKADLETRFNLSLPQINLELSSQ